MDNDTPTRVYVEWLDDRICVVADPVGAIALSPSSALEIARELLNQALLPPAVATD